MSQESKTNQILVVGLVCIDVVCYVEKFPVEDSDTRVFEQRTTLGGNATNSSVVLHQFDNGQGYELFASVPKDSTLLNGLLDEHKINIRKVEHDNASVPISTAIVNEKTGTRTILHYRGALPELTADDFIQKYPKLDPYTWIHFEGRNFDGLLPIIQYCNQTRNLQKTKLSIELEKIRDFNWYDKLIPHVDVIFMSKDFAKNLGFNSMTEAVNGFIERYDLDNLVIIPWGEEGVAAREGKNGQIVIQKAFVSPIVDTLAAGDTFIGAAIYFLNKRRPLSEVLEKACQVAGRKCGQRGLLNLDLSGL